MTRSARSRLPNEVDWKTEYRQPLRQGTAPWRLASPGDIANADNPPPARDDTNEFLNLSSTSFRRSALADIVFTATYPTGNKIGPLRTSQWDSPRLPPSRTSSRPWRVFFPPRQHRCYGSRCLSVFRKLPVVLDAVKGYTRYHGARRTPRSRNRRPLEVENWLVAGPLQAPRRKPHALRTSRSGASTARPPRERNPRDQVVHIRRYLSPRCSARRSVTSIRNVGSRGATIPRPELRRDDLSRRTLGYFIENVVP
jgi:hypothetical protein